AALDEVEVLARPVDRRAQPVLEPNRRLEAELPPRLVGAAEAEDRVVPRSLRGDLELGARTAQLQDQLRQPPDRRLDAAREVVDVSRRSLLRARQEPARDVLDVDEVAGRDAAVVELQR